MKKVVYISLMFVMLTASLSAQKLTTSVSSTKVALGEAFQLQFSLNGPGTNFKLPPMSEFDILEGPYQQQSTSVTNGNVVQSSSLTYLVAAKKEGKLTIGAATVMSNGKPLQSNVVTIEVTKGSGGGSSAAIPNNSGQNVTKPTSADIGDNVFVRLVVSKTKPYMGEVIEAKFKIYTRMEMQMRNISKFPSYAGFFVQDIKTNEKSSQTNETIDGVTYVVGEVYKTYLIPQHSGKIVLEPFEIECIIRQKSKRKPRDIFEQMMGVGYEEVMFPLKSQPVTIDVQSLPEVGKPAGFTGAVGNYSYKAVMTKESVKANDAVNITFSLSGTGNIKLVEPTKVNFPEDFETYDVKTGENINVSKSGISGSKTFDYLFIPRHEGDYKIEPVPFSYFDPSKKEYVTIPVPEFKLHVDKGEGGSAVVSNGTNVKDELKVLGNDIRYIKTATILEDKENFFFGSALFYSLLITPLLCFLAFIFIRRKNIEENKDGIAVKSRKARKMAKKRLSLAEQHLKSGNKELFYIEIFKALYGYISDKLNIPVADLNKEHISQTLRSRNVAETTVEKLISTIDSCEFARYAPSAASGDLISIYNNTVELIAKTEDEIA